MRQEEVWKHTSTLFEYGFICNAPRIWTVIYQSEHLVNFHSPYLTVNENISKLCSNFSIIPLSQEYLSKQIMNTKILRYILTFGQSPDAARIGPQFCFGQLQPFRRQTDCRPDYRPTVGPNSRLYDTIST